MCMLVPIAKSEGLTYHLFSSFMTHSRSDGLQMESLFAEGSADFLDLKGVITKDWSRGLLSLV